VTPGPGRNTVIAQNDDLVVYCGSGRTAIRPGNGRAVIYGGSGTDTLFAGRGMTWMDGGKGPAIMKSGSGTTKMISGGGTNTIETGPGPAEIVLDGGTNTIHLGSDKASLRVLRTGLPQSIHGFSGGTIDLSDWTPLGKVRIAQLGPDTVLTAVTERLVLVQADLSTVQPNVTGVTLDLVNSKEH